MYCYKVTYEQLYPDAEDDIRTAYVLAKDFTEAIKKVERAGKTDEYQSSKVLSVERSAATIIV